MDGERDARASWERSGREGGREAVKRVIWRRRRLKNIAAISAAGEG